MSNRRMFRRCHGAAADEREHKAACADDSDSGESVYAVSSSSSNSVNSSNSSLSSTDGYLQPADDCHDQEGGHYHEVGGYWEWRLEAERRCCLRTRPIASAVVASGKFIQTRSPWAKSSLLCGVSALLAACSLSSLAVCIAVTGISLSCIELSRDTGTPSAVEDDVQAEDISGDPQIDVWTERLMNPPLADRVLASSQQHASMQHEPAERYSWDCVALAGLATCSPVQKKRSHQGAAESSVRRPYRQSAAELHVLADGVYHVSAQIAGIVWLPPPPTLLRTVIARVKQKPGTVNLTTAHVITGEAGSGPLATARRGSFTVYMAAAVLLSAGDHLRMRTICVEEPECVVHINGTSSYLTLERLD